MTSISNFVSGRRAGTSSVFIITGLPHRTEVTRSWEDPGGVVGFDECGEVCRDVIGVDC